MELKIKDRKFLNKIENDELLKKGKMIYKRIKSKLENKFKGKVIAIEVDTGKYIIGEDELEVAIKAKNKFPDKVFAFFKIGYPAVHKLRKRENL